MTQYKKIIFLCLLISILTHLSIKAQQDNLDLKKIEQGVDKFLGYFSNNNPGAVVAVIKKGEIIFNKAYGLSNVEKQTPMNINQAFNLAELSKSFNTLAIFKLSENNKLSLEDNLQTIFPDFPEYGRNIKVSNLLNHTSGLKNYPTDEIKTNNDVYVFLKNQNETEFKPGTNWKYSNSDYALLVKIIEKVSEKSYKEYMEKYVFKKLKLENTFFSSEQNNNNVAKPHFKEDNAYIIKEVQDEVYGNQGIYTTSVDFAKWDKSLYTNKLLECESLGKMFSLENNSMGNKVNYYGYGWVLMEKDGIKYYWHGGASNGYSNIVLHLPDAQTTVLILTNRNDGYDFLKMSIYIAKLFDKDLKL